jgi:hypothetical protein
MKNFREIDIEAMRYYNDKPYRFRAFTSEGKLEVVVQTESLLSAAYRAMKFRAVWSRDEKFSFPYHLEVKQGLRWRVVTKEYMAAAQGISELGREALMPHCY